MVLLILRINTTEAPLAVPDVCAPVAVRDPIGPVDVSAFVQKPAETAVVALFERVCDGSAVDGVLAPAFEARFVDVVAVLAVVRVEDPVAVFAVVDVVAEAVGVVLLVGIEVRVGEADFFEFLFDSFDWPVGANFFEAGCIFGGGEFFVEQVIFFVG